MHCKDIALTKDAALKEKVQRISGKKACLYCFPAEILKAKNKPLKVHFNENI